jgi:hypothetical protein
MVGYEILEMHVEGRAIVGRVRMTGDDGHSEVRRYSWPLATPAEQIMQLLPGLYEAWVAEQIHTPERPVLELIGARFTRDADGIFVRMPAERMPIEVIPNSGLPA